MKFIILAAFFAIAAADSYRSAEYDPKYGAPAYQSTGYEAKYETAKPYDFSWAVNDYYNVFDHSEKSDGSVVTGVYRVVLPDGRTQIVTYKADSYGYTADVKYTGEAKYPEYVASNYKANTYSAPAYKPSTPSYTAPTYTAPAKQAPVYTVTAPTYTAPAKTAPVYTATPVYKAPAVQPQY